MALSNLAISLAAPAAVRDVLTAAADDLGDPNWDPVYGYGLVDAEESVTGTETA